jgi:hypothetical protein
MFPKFADMNLGRPTDRCTVRRSFTKLTGLGGRTDADMPRSCRAPASAIVAVHP